MSDFTNKIISGINSGLKTVGTGSKAAIKKTKLKSSIKKLENEIKDISSEIGVKLYNWCVLNPEGDIPRADYMSYLEEICSRNDLIKKYRAKIEEIDNEKGTSTDADACICGQVNEPDAKVCANCGKNLE